MSPSHDLLQVLRHPAERTFACISALAAQYMAVSPAAVHGRRYSAATMASTSTLKHLHPAVVTMPAPALTAATTCPHAGRCLMRRRRTFPASRASTASGLRRLPAAALPRCCLYSKVSGGPGIDVGFQDRRACLWSLGAMRACPATRRCCIRRETPQLLRSGRSQHCG